MHKDCYSFHAHNKSYLREQAKHPNDVSGNYISSFKENQLTKIEAIKSLFSFTKPPLAEVKPATREDASWDEMKHKAADIGKANTQSNKYDIRDPYWKLIKQNKRKIKRIMSSTLTHRVPRFKIISANATCCWS